jgi:hypothetical protein
MADDLANRVIATTIPKFFKGFEDGVEKIRDTVPLLRHRLPGLPRSCRRVLRFRRRISRGLPEFQALPTAPLTAVPGGGWPRFWPRRPTLLFRSWLLGPLLLVQHIACIIIYINLNIIS